MRVEKHEIGLLIKSYAKTLRDLCDEEGVAGPFGPEPYDNEFVASCRSFLARVSELVDELEKDEGEAA